MSAQVALWVQVAAVLAAVGASIIALWIAAADRRNARRIAAEDRRLATLRVDLDLLMRLLENYNKGGSTDRAEASRMGTEALTLVGVLGPERVPHAWGEKVVSADRLRELLQDPEMPYWKKDAIRVQLSVIDVTAEIRKIVDAQ